VLQDRPAASDALDQLGANNRLVGRVPVVISVSRCADRMTLAGRVDAAPVIPIPSTITRGGLVVADLYQPISDRSRRYSRRAKYNDRVALSHPSIGAARLTRSKMLYPDNSLPVGGLQVFALACRSDDRRDVLLIRDDPNSAIFGERLQDAA